MDVTIKNSLAIPVSAYAPISLERPLKLFGDTFRVHISTVLTLSPDTVLKSSYGISLLQWIRTDKRRMDRTLNALMRAGTGKNKLSETTRKLVKQQLGGFFPSGELDAVLQGREPTTPLPWQSDWAALLHGLGKPGDDHLYQLVAHLAELDQIVESARELADKELPKEGVALLEPYIGNILKSWQLRNSNLRWMVALVVDISLQTLAWLEWRSAPEQSSCSGRVNASSLVSLLAPGKKPIGHWLLRMQNSAGRVSLRDFSALMASKGIELHHRDISHDLLKKWSSGQQLMTSEGCQCVLKAVGRRVNQEREQLCFATARFLSFLCDLVIAGTNGEPPTWESTQKQIACRYRELYEIEGARREIDET